MGELQLASPDILKRLVQQQKAGEAVGIVSICSSNQQVLEASLQLYCDTAHLLLLETTCNQVNQFGGYTGDAPRQYIEKVLRLAKKFSFPVEHLLFGGDHLGPYPWRAETAETALAKSARMVQEYIQAGYRKIHLDTSMACVDDTDGTISKTTAAQRAADLCRIAEDESKKLTPNCLPVYVIGTEVPIPGGAVAGEDCIQRTTPQEAAETLAIFSQEFKRHKLEQAWERVIAMVVQPGVEFGDEVVNLYDRFGAEDLVEHIRQIPGIIYEAHSTDYQPTIALRQMVEDQFAILKVGPALTFAFREAVFALESIEKEWMRLYRGKQVSSLQETILTCMAAHPLHWSSHYHGSPAEIAFKQIYSYSDRIRYYWNFPDVQNALSILFANLRDYPPPIGLLSQFMPIQCKKVQSGQLSHEPQTWIWDYIQFILKEYLSTCNSV